MLVLLDPTATLGIRIAAALFLLWAAWGKLRDLARFRAAVADYRLLPAFAVAPVALAVPLAEFGIAAALCWSAFSPWPEFAGALLLLVFAAAMTINLLRDRRDIACGCSLGSAEGGLRWSFVGRNVAAAVLLALSGTGPQAQSLLEGLTGAVAGLALFALLAAADAVSALFARHPRVLALRKAS